jgi:hypothetical protein
MARPGAACQHQHVKWRRTSMKSSRERWRSARTLLSLWSGTARIRDHTNICFNSWCVMSLLSIRPMSYAGAPHTIAMVYMLATMATGGVVGDGVTA